MSSIIKTGIVDLSWSQIVGADGYNLEVIGDNLFYKNESVTGSSTASFRLSGVDDGVAYYAKVYYYSGYNTSVNYQITNTGVSAPENFHTTKGRTFSFDSVYLNDVNLNGHNTASGYFATGKYFSDKLNIRYYLINPRDDKVLSYAETEPFFSGTTFFQNLQTQNTAQRKFWVKPALNPTSASVFGEGTSDSSDLFITNQTDSRNFNFEFRAIDYYGSGIPANIYLINDPIEVQRLTATSLSGINDQTGYLNIRPTYSTAPVKSDFFVTTNEFYPNGHVISSGTIYGNDSATLEAPYASGLFIKFKPFDYFGSGVDYYKSGVRLSNESYFQNDSIKLFDVSTIGDYQQYATFLANRNSKDGYYFKMSIDSSPTGKFNADSYFTGMFQNETGHLFSPDLFSLRTGTHETFYGNLDLYSSGDHTLQDSKQSSIFLQYPKIVGDSVHFDYEKGLTTFQFDSNFDESKNDLRYLISGKNDPIGFYTGIDYHQLKTGELISELNVKLQRASDGFVYDEKDILASGHLPKVGVHFDSAATTLDGQATIQFGSVSNNIPINYIQISRKPAFEHLYQNTGLGPPTGLMSSTFSGLLSGIENFEDYSDRVVNKGYIGIHFEKAPDGAKVSQTYSAINEFGAPFYYESGSHYVYRFVPINGYGSGIVTSPFIYKFQSNNIFQDQSNTVSTHSNQITTTESDIYNINNSDSSFAGKKEFIDEASFDSNVSISGQITSSINVSGDIHTSGNLNVSGICTISGYNPLLLTNIIPTGSSAAGTKGMIAINNTGLYICVSNNNWRVTPLHTF